MKRPLVAVVSGYVIGLLLAGIFHLPLGALFAISFLVLILVLVFEKFRPWLIWLLLVLAGWTNLTTRTAIVSPDDLRGCLDNNTAIVTVHGTLLETPRIKIVERDDQQTVRSLARVRVTELRREENWQPATGEVMVATPGTLPANFFAGQPVEITGVIARPPPLLAEGLFDYRDYLETRGIYYQLKTGSTNDWQLRPPPLTHPPLTDRFLNWSKKTLALGLPVEDEPLRLLWAMTLGWRTAFTGDISEPFLRAGTMHLFAIDGLRIALISGMLVALLRVLQVSRGWCGLVAIPLIWFYTAATGWESSAIRASVMMTIVLGGWALKRPGDTVNSLAAAAFIILLWEPRQLFEASFQLSFFVVLIIALMLPPLNRLVDRMLRHDPLVPDELLPRWRRAFTATLRLLGRYCALSFAAWAGSIPLAAKYFHLFSPVSTPANIVAVPLGTLALMSNLGALLSGTWLPWVTVWFNHSAWFFMMAMTWVSEVSTRIPGAFCYVAEPSWLDIGVYYAVLVGVLSSWLWAAKRRIWSAVALVLIVAGYAWHWQATRDEIKLTVLPLNGGHSVFVDAPGRKNDWLVDCGNDDAVGFTLKPFLRGQGVNQVQQLVLTHGDLKNVGGAEQLDQLFGVGELWTSPARFRSAAYREIVAGFDKPPARHKMFNCGATTGGWRVLHPGAGDNFPRADDGALVLLGDYSSARVLLLSDLGRDGQNALLARTNDLRADIVIAGLPNEGEPLSDELLDAIRPRVIVIADSEFPATRRAGSELKERLAGRNVPVIYTRTAGAVTILVRPDDWELQTMDGQGFKGGRTGF
ncbi:MAG TPA: ComEC/Rec2 family competence protein [Verrucomicrobiae bacterium]|nr:ComEC/Rec2 family competence protein [Verrucomicrobiae bacterium]